MNQDCRKHTMCGAGLVGQGVQDAQVFFPAQPGGQPFYGLRLGQVGTEAQAVGQADGLQVLRCLTLWSTFCQR